MDESYTKCANCGRILSTPNDICPQCELEFSRPRKLVFDPDHSEILLDPSIGKYCCPHCNAHFNEPKQILWPLNAPWYRGQNYESQCPHCKIFLLDKITLSLKEHIVLLMFFVIFDQLIFRLSPNCLLCLVFLMIILFIGIIKYSLWKRKTIGNDRYTIKN